MTAAGAPTLTRGRAESGTMLLDRPVDFGDVFDVPAGPVVERIVDITTPPRISAFANATIVAAGHEGDDPEDSLVPPTCAGADVRTEAEFTDLYEKHFSELAAQVCAYLGDATEAQDLVQEAFLRAWQRWDKVGAYEEPVAWVRRVAWNLATSRHRRNQVARKFLQKSSAPELSPAASPDHVALVAALKLVPAKRRQALVMHYMADMTVNAIAAATGAKEGTVKSWLHRGRKELAALLTDEAADAKPAKAVKTAEADPDTMPIRIKRAIPGARSANRRASVKEDRS
ncbi:SigE family RNA polymerase sigma factor [Glycomyces luteolus]|uniref:SigE family RNA polymerase sigma factor n=1 Tax=Glycomyces luteolus TaxID=2670330 RepID=A0A9X3SQU6_9ACTN|nr:SigE family RNA polymerase sigma factor [Glycomyces luteolus]MDA1360566.1 SigE family RNA polymerase sigma factor [Glycomyces luteolus]